jgi:hypothetical protein
LNSPLDEFAIELHIVQLTGGNIFRHWPSAFDSGACYTPCEILRLAGAAVTCTMSAGLLLVGLGDCESRQAQGPAGQSRLTDEKAKEIRTLRESGQTVPAIIKRTAFSKTSVYRALSVALPWLAVPY